MHSSGTKRSTQSPGLRPEWPTLPHLIHPRPYRIDKLSMGGDVGVSGQHGG